jgi:hypothetical protein
VLGTALGLFEPEAHFNWRLGTLPVAAEELLPSILYETMQLLGVLKSTVHPRDLPEFESTDTVAAVLK